MNSSKRFAVIGGDDRQGCLANSLKDDGCDVVTSGLAGCPVLSAGPKQLDVHSAIRQADVVVLPLPISRDTCTINAPYCVELIYLKDVLNSVGRGQVVTGGLIDDEFAKAITARGAAAHDYFKREELTVLNAIPTAEGALEIILRETNHTVYGSKILISGFGRIGKVLTKMFVSLSADVTVSVRKHSDSVWAQIEGAKSAFAKDLQDMKLDEDIVINTVPSMIFDENLLAKMNKSAIIVDLASAPGGIDIGAAKNMGIKVIVAQSLPGKCAPQTAGEFIKETIMNILEESNV